MLVMWILFLGDNTM